MSLGVACGLFINGQFYVSNHTPWGLQRKLSVWHAIYCYQPLIRNRDPYRCLLVPSDILQSTNHKCLWGNLNNFILMLVVCLCLMHLTSNDLQLILAMIQNVFIILVSGKTVWEIREIISVARLLNPNDSLHGNCALCSSLGIWKRHRCW